MHVCVPQDVRSVHIRFIDECFERLEDLTNQNPCGTPPRTSSGHVTDPEIKLQAIERLLLLAQRYITTVEVCLCVCACACNPLALALALAIPTHRSIISILRKHECVENPYIYLQYYYNYKDNLFVCLYFERLSVSFHCVLYPSHFPTPVHMPSFRDVSIGDDIDDVMHYRRHITCLARLRLMAPVSKATTWLSW